jgi:hypothetical protein
VAGLRERRATHGAQSHDRTCEIAALDAEELFPAEPVLAKVYEARFRLVALPIVFSASDHETAPLAATTE